MESNVLKNDLAIAVGCPSQTDLAGKADVCVGCPGRQLCQSQSGVDQDQPYIDIRMKAVKKKILVLSGKGGVGKSTIASNLAMALGQLCGPKKVGLLDVDICGPSSPKLMNVEHLKIINSPYGWMPLESPHLGVKVISAGSLIQENSSAIVWRGPRKTALIKRFLKDTFWGRLDYLIFDTPPGTSDEHLTVIKTLVNVKPEGAIIVTTPQDVALDTIRKEIDFCHKMGLKIIGIIENMSGYACPCCKEYFPLFSEGGASRLSLEYGIPVLGRLPLDPNLAKCCEEGKNIQEENGGRSPVAIAMMDLARTLHNQT